jgi:hypothetical protein
VSVLVDSLKCRAHIQCLDHQSAGGAPKLEKPETRDQRWADMATTVLIQSEGKPRVDDH